MGRAAIIILIGSIILFGILNMNTITKLSSATDNSIEYNSTIGARNICNTMVEMILAKLANDAEYRVLTPEVKSIFNGTATYTVVEVESIDQSDGEDVDGRDDHGADDHGEDDHGADDGHSNNIKNLDNQYFQNNFDNSTNYAGLFSFNTNNSSNILDIENESFSSGFYDSGDEDDHGEDDHGEDDHGEDDHGEDDHGEDLDEIDEVSVTESKIIKIYVSAELDGKIQTATVYVSLPDGGFIPDALMAAITANCPIETLGNLIIDGRNHTIDGTLKENSGTNGIWTTSSFRQRGNSNIGGTFESIDYIPSKPGNANIIKEGQTWTSGTYPTTPDKVLGGSSEGFAEGTLKSIAQSGEGGSQYVVNPDHLSFPLHGVTYVELESGGNWTSAKITGSGLLIVHNINSNAVLKNVNNGPFTGLLIADDIIHFHTELIGGIFILSPTPSDGNCLGNGSGSILYSSKAIASGVEDAGGVGNLTTNYGFGKHRLKILTWYE